MSCHKANCFATQDVINGMIVCKNGHARQLSQDDRTIKQTPPQQSKLIRQQTKNPRNHTEQAFENEVLYWQKLKGEILRYEFSAITLKLKSNGVRYTPDFFVINADGPSLNLSNSGLTIITFYECKGEQRGNRVIVRDDASVKIKTAANDFPEWRFVLVWKDPITKVWQEQKVLPEIK